MQQTVSVLHNACHTISPNNQSEIWTAGRDYHIKELKLLYVLCKPVQNSNATSLDLKLIHSETTSIVTVLWANGITTFCRRKFMTTIDSSEIRFRQTAHRSFCNVVARGWFLLYWADAQQQRCLAKLSSPLWKFWQQMMDNLQGTERNCAHLTVGIAPVR